MNFEPEYVMKAWSKILYILYDVFNTSGLNGPYEKADIIWDNSLQLGTLSLKK